MSERSALLREILTNPGDDTARLVFADFLRECDGDADQARGRFLWAGVVASRFRGNELIEDREFYLAQGEIDAVASAGHPTSWLHEVGLAADSDDRKWAWDCMHDRVTVRIGGASGTFARGLLTEIGVPLRDWARVAARVLESSPLEVVSVSDVPGLKFVIEQRPDAWRVTARMKVPPQRIAFMTGPIPTSVSPTPFLVETDADWSADETFQTREEMAAEIVKTTQFLMEELREALGNRWPRRRS